MKLIKGILVYMLTGTTLVGILGFGTVEISLVAEVAAAIFSGLAALLWWAFMQIVKAQEKMGLQIEKLSLAVTKICGQVEKSTQWQEMHESHDTERDRKNSEAHAAMAGVLEKIRG